MTEKELSVEQLLEIRDGLKESKQQIIAAVLRSEKAVNLIKKLKTLHENRTEEEINDIALSILQNVP